VAPEYSTAMFRKGFDLVTVASDTGLLSLGAALHEQFSTNA
jgi:hypothetical protein